jgi:hypothetical protein
MRELMMNDVNSVAGGTDAAQAATNVCRNNNLPASTPVTITMTVGGNLSAFGSGTATSTTITIETTCGDLVK